MLLLPLLGKELGQNWFPSSFLWVYVYIRTLKATADVKTSESKGISKRGSQIVSSKTIKYTAKNKYRKFETNIPGKGIARPQSQFPRSCVCERFIYSHDRSAYSAAGNKWTDPGNI
jgi:hypothetical protein